MHFGDFLRSRNVPVSREPRHSFQTVSVPVLYWNEWLSRLVTSIAKAEMFLSHSKVPLEAIGNLPAYVLQMPRASETATIGCPSLDTRLNTGGVGERS